MAISTTSQFLVPDGISWLLCPSKCLAEGEKSPMAFPLPCQHHTTTALGKKPQPLPTACNTKSSTSEKAELKRRLPSRSRNTQPRMAEQPASQRSQNLHESPRSRIWAKARTILAGIVATVGKSQKAITALSLIAEEPYPCISFDFFNS